MTRHLKFKCFGKLLKSSITSGSQHNSRRGACVCVRLYFLPLCGLARALRGRGSNPKWAAHTPDEGGIVTTILIWTPPVTEVDNSAVRENIVHAGKASAVTACFLTSSDAFTTLINSLLDARLWNFSMLLCQQRCSRLWKPIAKIFYQSCVISNNIKMSLFLNNRIVTKCMHLKLA